MVSANPRDIGNLYRPRTQEFTGGTNPREVLDLQINPNEDDDGLSHNSRNTTEDSESRDQRDPQKRREKALRELAPALMHISLKPEKMDEMVLRSPRFEEENKLLESRLGVDLGARGLSLAAGANRGPARSDTPYVTYGRDNSLGAFGKSDIEKAKRKYKGRKYSEDEESEEEEKKSKRSNKRKKKRSGRKGKAKAGGKLRGSASRDPKRTSSTRAGRALSRRFGLGSSTELPLRLRDPIAYARKLANEKLRRETGALPQQFTAHRSASAGVSEGQTRGGFIGGTKGSGTRMATPPNLGTSMRAGASVDRLMRDAVGDPLGTNDPLMAKSLSRVELIDLKKKIEALLRKLNKVVKAPEHEENAKRGAQASEDVATAPQGGTSTDNKPQWLFEDTSVMLEIGAVGKK